MEGAGAGRMRCRLWWPRHLLSESWQSDSMLLLGWVIPGFHNSIDIVVANSMAFEESGSPSVNTHVQAIIELAQTQMPLSLREHADVSVVGYCVLKESCKNSQNNRNRTNLHASSNKRKKEMESDPSMTYGCVKNNEENNQSCMLEQYLQCRIKIGVWIALLFQPVSLPSKELTWVPELSHLHWEGSICAPDVHTVIYEQPTYGKHHFSFKSWRTLSTSSESFNGGKPSIKPTWMVELELQQEPSNLDVIILAINSSAAVQNIAQDLLNSLHSSCKQISLFSIMIGLLRKMTAANVALVATVFYIGLQLIYRIICKTTFSFLNIILKKLFRQTWINLRIRSHQLICWPAILLGSGCGFQPNVAVAHRSALLKHSAWSAIAIDIFLGNLTGMMLLINCKTTSDWVLHFVCNVTDNMLRSGCVWLMGVPAGFKLNTELAETLGMTSLNIIQVWSRLWVFAKPLLKHSIRVLAICGIFFGFTVQAALLIDIILLATLHISTLHWLLALVYSHQIQALSALSRLFRGRKRNPLRARIDSYDYSVDQHVVGSLVFTPLLLLVPTTSVFYVFFSILNSVVSLACISSQFFISVLHAFPYAEIAIWLVHPKRFPSGVWFKQICTGSVQLADSMLSCLEVMKIREERKADFICSVGSMSTDNKESPSPLTYAESQTGQCSTCFFSHDSEIVVSALGITSASLGEIIHPHLIKIFKGLSLSSGASCAYKVFSGGRIPSSLDIGMPSPMPWLSIGFKEFWWLTYEAVLGCL